VSYGGLAKTTKLADFQKLGRGLPVLVHWYRFAGSDFESRVLLFPGPTPATLIPSNMEVSLTGSERRTTQRFSMRLPLTVRWTTARQLAKTMTESRDVSSRGVYFFLSKDIKEGSPVEILLTLPNEITLAGPVRVRCLGRVQRTEPRDEGAIGVVAAIERYEFLRAPKKCNWRNRANRDSVQVPCSLTAEAGRNSRGASAPQRSAPAVVCLEAVRVVPKSKVKS